MEVILVPRIKSHINIGYLMNANQISVLLVLKCVKGLMVRKSQYN